MEDENDKNLRSRGAESRHFRNFTKRNEDGEYWTAGTKNKPCKALDYNSNLVMIKDTEFTTDVIENNTTIIPNIFLFTYVADEFSKNFAGVDFSKQFTTYPFTIISKIKFSITNLDILDRIKDIHYFDSSAIDFEENVSFTITLIEDKERNDFYFSVVRAEIINA